MGVRSRLMTAEDMLRLPDDDMRHELIDGIHYVFPPPGAEHGRVAQRMAFLLQSHVLEGDLGEVFAAETGFVLRRGPDTVRGPDVSFVRRARYDALGATFKHWPEAPDLAVEVTSPDDRPREVDAKARLWVDAGTTLVLVADPAARTITAYRADEEPRIHAGGDTVDAGDAVPDWTLAVDDAFNRRPR